MDIYNIETRIIWTFSILTTFYLSTMYNVVLLYLNIWLWTGETWFLNNYKRFIITCNNNEQTSLTIDVVIAFMSIVVVFRKWLLIRKGLFNIHIIKIVVFFLPRQVYVFIPRYFGVVSLYKHTYYRYWIFFPFLFIGWKSLKNSF